MLSKGWKCYFRDSNLKISRGACPRIPLEARTFGARDGPPNLFHPATAPDVYRFIFKDVKNILKDVYKREFWRELRTRPRMTDA